MRPTTRRAVVALLTGWLATAQFGACGAPDADADAAAAEPKAGWLLDYEQHCNLWNPAPNVRDGVSWSGRCITEPLPDGTKSAPVADGEGVLRWCHGTRATLIFVGSVKAGHLQGKGIVISMDGTARKGQFESDEMTLVEGSTSTTIDNLNCVVPNYAEWARRTIRAANGNAAPPDTAQRAAQSSDGLRSPPTDHQQHESEAPSKEEGSTVVKLVKAGGVYEVPVLLNDALTIKFVIDSGATDVSITPDVFITLIRTGTVSKSDFLPDASYTQADGTTTKNKRFRLHTVRIGGRVLRDVHCSVSPSLEGAMLLGQSALEKLGKFSIDYESQSLVIDEPQKAKRPASPGKR
jgi:predicted aspartyl protease